MKRLVILLSLFVAAGAASAAPQGGGPTATAPAAKAGPGTAAVKTANEKISALLKQKPAAGSPQEKELAGKVTTSVRDFLDIDELGKRAMSDQWSKLTKEQQAEFLSTLRALIEDNYVKGLRSNLAYTVDYTGETTDKDGNTIVTTTVNTKRKGRPFKINIDYVLKKDGDKLKAWDVKTDGVGLVDNYRVQFNKIIEKDGFPGLIAKMKKKQSGAG
ncbi:MAG TPA: ABC transporter substrate-binding protein [Kofleriaceae bacterium]|nr:ABC transporter substrate-binding protein [Kofleriaceae bacterium]